MPEPAKWLPDPFGRFEQRYFDGSNWTAHVSSGGVQSVDPLGTTMSVPFATPTAGAPAAPSATSSRAFLDGLGLDARERLPVQMSIALAGVGGAVAAVGIAGAIVGDGGVDNRARTIPAAVVLVVLAYAVRLGVKAQPELRSAAVGAAFVGIPAVAAAITSGGDGGGTMLLAAVLLIAAWALPGMRGRPLMLGAGAIAIVLALTTVGGNSSSSTDLFDLGPADFIGGQTWIFVIVGIAFLAMVWWLDDNDFRGVGTSLVVAALLATALAVLKVVQNLGSTGGALLLAVAGLAVAVVGDHGQRRASTWFGVAVAAIGTVAVLFSAIDATTTTEVATTLFLSGAVLVIAAVIVKKVVASRAVQAET
ncbi:MAG: DUF2510 domain-containing protein [Ilumatobacteraceae bacterium]